MPLHRTKQVGFTLLELLVVLLIIGLLAGYVGPKYFSQISNANVTATKDQMDAFEKALDRFRMDTGHYPTQQETLSALFVCPNNEPKCQGPYLAKSLPADPWGHPYTYTIPGGGSPARDYDIISAGPDGVAGTADDVTSY